MKKLLLAILALLLFSCSLEQGKSSDERSLIKFVTPRKFTVVNTRLNKIVYSIEGYIESTKYNNFVELNLKTKDGKTIRHYFVLSQDLAIIVEKLETFSENRDKPIYGNFE